MDSPDAGNRQQPATGSLPGRISRVQAKVKLPLTGRQPLPHSSLQQLQLNTMTIGLRREAPVREKPDVECGQREFVTAPGVGPASFSGIVTLIEGAYVGSDVASHGQIFAREPAPLVAANRASCQLALSAGTRWPSSSGTRRRGRRRS